MKSQDGLLTDVIEYFMLIFCLQRFLQMQIFNVQPHAQKDHNSNEIFVMGETQCAAPMTKNVLPLWSFCVRNLSLKIDVCKYLLAQKSPHHNSLSLVRKGCQLKFHFSSAIYSNNHRTIISSIEN